MRSRRASAVATMLLSIAAAARAGPPATAPVSTQPTSSPAEVAAADRRGRFLIDQREAIADMLKAFPAQPARRPDELVHVALVDGNLRFTLAPDAPDQASFPTPGGAIKLNVMSRGPDPSRGELIAFDFECTVLREGPDEPTAALVQIGSTPPTHLNFSVTGQTPLTTAAAEIVASLQVDETGQSDPPAVTLHFDFGRAEGVDDNDPDATAQQPGKLQRSAPSFVGLIEAHHDDVVTATAEAFTSLRAMHVLSGLNEAQLRQVLATDAPADPKQADAANALLASLDGDDEAASVAARKRLEAGDGMSLAIALAAADRHGWSPDRSMKVDALLADVLPLSQRQARRALATPTRLVDALYWPDAGLRRAIKARLAPIASRVADIDADADPYPQTGKIEAIRAALLHTPH